MLNAKAPKRFLVALLVVACVSVAGALSSAQADVPLDAGDGGKAAASELNRGGATTLHLTDREAKAWARTYLGYAKATHIDCAITWGAKLVAQAAGTTLSAITKIPYLSIGTSIITLIGQKWLGTTPACAAAIRYVNVAQSLTASAKRWNSTKYQSATNTIFHDFPRPNLCQWRIWINGIQRSDIRWPAGISKRCTV